MQPNIRRPIMALGLAALALMAGAVAASAQEGVTRTELSRKDLTGSGTTEVIVARLELAPGAGVPLHTHFGDEHLYIIQGGMLRTAQGKVVEFKTGQAFFFPREQVHGGLTVVGDKPVTALTIHIVDKGRPLATPVP